MRPPLRLTLTLTLTPNLTLTLTLTRCGRSFGWPPARVSHEKLCAGGAAAADDATSSHACTAVAVWCTDRPRPALQLTLALALALTLTRCTDRPRPALQLSDGMDEVRATPTSLEP